MSMETVDTGLDGVPVCTSDISLTSADADGNPVLIYRGYSIYDLVKGLFEESVYLLLTGELPNKAQLAEFSNILRQHAEPGEAVRAHIRTYPENVNMMDFLLTTLSYARMFDEDYQNALWEKPRMDEANADLILNTGLRMGAKIPAILAGGHRVLNHQAIIPPDPNLNYAANFLNMLGIKPEADIVNVLNTVLILYLDHTINCSTFTSLVAESAMTDPYGPLLAGGIALKGVRHGGANELACDMYEEIGRPENAEAYIYDKLKNKEIVFGFGHRLPQYKHSTESRVRIAEQIGRPLAKQKGLGHYFEIYDIISQIMLREKNRTPNADLPIAILLKIAGLPKSLNTPLFQASRHFGWLANNLRQRRAKGPLYRPTQVYKGVKEIRHYVSLENR
jgi:citrate synthase